MANFFELSGLNPDRLFAELDREYYKAFPEEWTDLVLNAPCFAPIVRGEVLPEIVRPRQSDDIVCEQSISQDGLIIWAVGQTYPVVEAHFTVKSDSPGEETWTRNHSKPLGTLRLIQIQVGDSSDTLRFECVTGAKESAR